MTSQISLTYGNKPVRALVSSAGLWFAAHDLFQANRRVTDRRFLACFDPAHLSLQTFPSDAGPVRLTAVSPLGAATIANRLNPLPARLLDGWVRRITREQAAEHGFEPLGWTLLADGLLPAKPKAYTEAGDAWKALKAQHRVWPTQRRPNIDEPSLFDDNPTLPPHDPEGDRRRAAEVQAAREAERARRDAEDPEWYNKLLASMASRR